MGFPHPKYLLPYLTADEFTEWQAYFAMEPWGSERDDFRIGTAISALLLPHQGKDTKPYKWTDWFPREAQGSKKQSVAQMKATMMQLVTQGDS